MNALPQFDTVTDALQALPARLDAIVHFHAARTPHAPAIEDAGRCWRYGELAQAVDHAADLLRALGVRAGDRVMVVGENCAAQVILSFAVSRCDAWIVHVNSRLSAREVDEIRAHSGARRVLYLCATAAPGTAPGTAPAAPETLAHARRHGATAIHSPCGPWMVSPLDTHCVPEAVHADGAQQVAALVYTSGTTGQPKGVMLSHRSLLFIAAVSSRLRGLTPADRAWGVLPISHVYGMTSVMLGTLYAGACLVLCQRYSPDAMLGALRNDRLTIIQGVPAMYARLLAKLGDAGAATPLVNTLRFAYAGGSPLAPSLKARVERLLGLPLHNGYGLSEAAPTVSQTRLEQPRSDSSVGLPIPGVAVRLAPARGTSTDGADAAAAISGNAAEGELWVRGPNVMLGYYRAPALTAAVLGADGWLNTGDVVRQEAEGALFIVGRTKELIIRSGFNVYPLEVETLLNAHPGVTQSAVVGRPAADGSGDEDVVAYYEADPQQPASPEVLHAWLAPQLAPYKRPATIIAMAALPAGATGKILKAQLRALAPGAPSAQHESG